MATVRRLTTPPGAPDRPRPYEVRWSVPDAVGGRKHYRRCFRSRRDADAHRRAVETATAAPGGPALPDHAGARESFAHWAERWYASAAPLARPSTARAYRSVLNAGPLAAFGRERIAAITTADVQDWINAGLARGLTPPTLRHHLTAARWVFREAVRARALTYNPALDVRLPTDRSVGRLKPQPRFLTAAEVEAVAGALDRAAPGAPWGLLVRFAAWTGLRAGEVAGLNVGDVDLAAGLVHVRRTRERRAGAWSVSTPKSGKARRVPLVGWLAEDLAGYLAAHPRAADPAAPLWPGGRAGGHTHGQRETPTPPSGAATYEQPWEAGTFYRRRYLPAVRAAGLTGVRFHDLRHTYASLCASAGVRSAQVAAWMGHASDVITRTTYTHLFAEDTTAAVAALEALSDHPRRPALRVVRVAQG